MLGTQWQIYSYPPSSHIGGKPYSDSVAPQPVGVQENSELPSFLQKSLQRVATKFADRFDKSSSGIDCRDFYLDIGYYEDERNVRIYGFGLKNRDDHDKGKGKEILQYFFSSLAIYAPKSVDVTLSSVTTAIGFYLRCGMAIQALGDTYVDPVDVYYTRKAELFGDAWDKYRVEQANKIPPGEITYDIIYPLFEASDFYKEGDPPGVFSMWIEDILWDRSHHMIYHIDPKRNTIASLSV